MSRSKIEKEIEEVFEGNIDFFGMVLIEIVISDEISR